MPGDIVDWPEDAARAQIAAGHAVAVEEGLAADIETAAVRVEAELAAIPKGRKK